MRESKARGGQISDEILEAFIPTKTLKTEMKKELTLN